MNARLLWLSAEDAPAPTSEATLQAHVIELAQNWLGWRVLHLRAGRTKRGKFGVQVTGKLGKGWPDLILAKPGRLVAAELKSDTGKLTPEQLDVLQWLQGAGVETYIWRPADWPEIVRCLGGTP